MADHLTRERRSWNMSRIRSGDTKPERIVRSMLHAMGYRFRLQGRVSRRLHPKGRLPGRPDIVLARHRTAVFVHGCFWHRHKDCKYATTPKTRTDWWKAKFQRNVERDAQTRDELEALGWHVIVVWECELRQPDALAERLEQTIARKPLNYPEEPQRENRVAAETDGTYRT
jgi:DNA mismatch endonuclease (patch repair protein)